MSGRVSFEGRGGHARNSSSAAAVAAAMTATAPAAGSKTNKNTASSTTTSTPSTITTTPGNTIHATKPSAPSAIGAPTPTTPPRTTATINRSSSHPPHTSTLHTHRQNHNSSKLPAFRFADLNSKHSLALPMPLPHSFLQHIPPSPVSPKSGPNDNPSSMSGEHQITTNQETPKPPTTTTTTHQQHYQHHRHQSQKLTSTTAVTDDPKSPPRASPRSRASTFQPSSNSGPVTPSATTQRPASFPDSPVAAVRSQEGSLDDTAANSNPAAQGANPQHRRAPASYSSNGIETGSGPPPALNTHRLQAIETAQAAQPSAEKTTKEWAQGQRELLLPKSLQASPTDEKRNSITSRPPVSFRNPSNSSATSSVRVAPIRGFRSSGARRSIILDMNTRTRPYDLGDDASDSNQLDRTLRALEGRPDDDVLQITPPDSADQEDLDGDDTGDVFMKIAREESTRRGADENAPMEEPTAISRVARSSHRRPLSAAIPSYQPTSPPRISRRLSDQQETSRSRSRQLDEDRSIDTISRTLTYRSSAREKAASTYPAEDQGRTKPSGSGNRPSPITPRSFAFQDSPAENSPYGRRRTSITESNSGLTARNSTYKQSNLSHGRTYNSSPLVPRHVEAQRAEANHETNHGVEGTESTASTTAPSTVWDELDDLKSRIHRLELTGKIPSTSGAAMSRLSDERPPTATTTVTTMSTSPKRGSGSGGPAADVSSTTSSQRDAQPLLLSAVTKSKPFLGPEVYKALETAAADALSLSSMMGIVGQPGPISSGASTIGGGSTVTDRQLRRKAESICRSLTELCLALSEEVTQTRTGQITSTPQKETPASPTIAKGFAGLAAQRRASTVAEPSVTRVNSTTSPRTMTRLEERRNTMLNFGTLASPRFVPASPSTPTEAAAGAGRKSSLLIGRTRRAGTEEPEQQQGRQSSLLLRSRRAGTEEPDEGRKTSLLLRGRRGTLGDEDDEARFRAPSRANTEVAAARGPSQTHIAQVPLADPSLSSSALPRRRLVPSALNSRLIAPSTPTALAGRRYLERSTPERDGNSVADKLAEERGQRQYSLGQTAMLNRTGSINRRQQNRDSTITNVSTAAQAGGYR